MSSALIGLLLGLCIGAGCRWLDLPLPAPPRIVGAMLVVPPPAMAELLPVIEAVMVAKLNEQMEISYGRETR